MLGWRVKAALVWDLANNGNLSNGFQVFPVPQFKCHEVPDDFAIKACVSLFVQANQFVQEFPSEITSLLCARVAQYILYKSLQLGVV
jgi:hypothetical protein